MNSNDTEVLDTALQKKDKAQNFLDNGKYQQALLLGEESLKLFYELENWKEVILVRCIIAYAYADLAQIEDAQTYLNETLDFAGIHFSDGDDIMADVYYCFGYFHGQVHRDAYAAMAWYEKSLDIIKDKREGKNNFIVKITSAIGFCYTLKGDYENALKYTIEAFELAKTNPNTDKILIIGSLNNIGTMYASIRNYQKSVLYVQQSLNLYIEEFGETNVDAGRLYHNIGGAYLESKEYEKAIENSEKGLQIRLDCLGEKHPHIALSYNQLGRIYANMGEWEKSNLYSEKALRIQEVTIGNDHLRTAVSRFTIAKNYLELEDIKEAIRYYELGIENFPKYFNYKHRLISVAFGNLAISVAKEKNYAKAFDYLQKAFNALFEKDCISDDIFAEYPVFDVEDLNLIQTLNIKANILYDYSKTVSESELKAFETVMKTHQISHEIIQRLQKNYRREYSQLIFSETVLKVYEDGIRVGVEAYQKYFESNILDFAFASSEKTKASILLTNVQENRIKNLYDLPESLIMKEKELKVELTYLEKNIQKEEAKKGDGNKELLKRWQNDFFGFHQEYLQLLQQLETDYPDYYQLKYDTKTVTSPQLQSILQENQVIVSYFIGKDKLYIFVVTSDEFEVIDLQKPNDFEALIEGLMEALTQHQFAVFTQKSYQLHQLLVAPIRDFIVDDFGFEEEELKQVFVIPHGVLNYLPFEVLIGSRPSKMVKVKKTLSTSPHLDKNLNAWNELDYLLNHCEISYHYSATLLYQHLLKKQKEEELPNSFAGFAPIYDTNIPSKSATSISPDSASMDALQESAKAIQTWATRSEAIRSDGTWVSLPHSETEAKGIAKLFEEKGLKSEVFLRNKASKEGFSDAAKRFKFLLVAAHGVVNDEKTALSGLVFYPSEGSDKKEEKSERQDEINDSAFPTFRFSHSITETDSVLSMEETHHLDLQADLVVLSSCESGIGTLHKGEGMMAVNRGFLAAGANNVVSTLFKVYDKPSSLLTQYFFEAILEGEEYASALRTAKLKLMQQPNIDPKSWSGFVLIGG